MSVAEELETLREELPGCTLVAFTDLSSKLVLSSSSAVRPAQEELDALSEAAHLALNGTVSEGAAPVWQDEAAQDAGTAMLLTATEARVVVRRPGENSEALVCVCTPGADLAKAADKGRAALDRILSEN